MTLYRKSPEAIAALTAEQFRVTQENATERPGSGELLFNQQAGIYVDIVSGEPLFGSLDKYDSGTGWPSFTKPLVDDNIVEKSDRKLFTVRTEVLRLTTSRLHEHRPRGNHLAIPAWH